MMQKLKITPEMIWKKRKRRCKKCKQNYVITKVEHTRRYSRLYYKCNCKDRLEFYQLCPKCGYRTKYKGSQIGGLYGQSWLSYKCVNCKNKIEIYDS